MTKTTTPHRFAGTAIVAFLVLGSTSAWAQETPAPAAAAAAQPAPTIVLPPVVAVQPAPAPVVETATGVEPAAAPRTSTVRATRGSSTATRTVPARVVRPQVDTSTSVAAARSASVAEVAPVIPEAAAPVDLTTAELLATAAPAGQSDSNQLLLAGLAGALGLGAIGLFAATRRRRVEPDDTVVELEPVSAPAEPVLATPTPPATLTTPVFTPIVAWSEPRVPLAQPADNRVPSLNRSALLARMVAAAPDANNPFKSDKARRRRARLMLQSMENDRWEGAELAPGFDWREMAQAVEERETVKA